MKRVVITGMSGAGRSVALKALEDAGFEAIDNLPLSFLPVVAQAMRNLAVGVDIRSRDFSGERLSETLSDLRTHGPLPLIYLDCADEALERRFTETRRRHPLAVDRPAADGIRQERELLAPVRALADRVIDTTGLSAAELRRMITEQFAAEERRLSLTVMSFSYRNGLPREADVVIDARFLRNPHYVEELRPLSGRDARVGAYIEEDPAFTPFFEGLSSWLLPLLPHYLAEGKQYLTLAIGCTGGQHRSVYVAEKLVSVLETKKLPVTVRHRELR